MNPSFHPTFIITLFWLLVGHALADYPLQGDFLAKAKNHLHPIPGIPWQIALVSHAFIHAGFVALITGSVWMGILELIFHSAIDYYKCSEQISFAEDQSAHIVLKVFFAAVASTHFF